MENLSFLFLRLQYMHSPTARNALPVHVELFVWVTKPVSSISLATTSGCLHNSRAIIFLLCPQAIRPHPNFQMPLQAITHPDVEAVNLHRTMKLLCCPFRHFVDSLNE